MRVARNREVERIDYHLEANAFGQRARAYRFNRCGYDSGEVKTLNVKAHLS
jgi:hypothetical protein